jgi:hypothetical protein
LHKTSSCAREELGVIIGELTHRDYVGIASSIMQLLELYSCSLSLGDDHRPDNRYW